jgi:hypothetical protein
VNIPVFSRAFLVYAYAGNAFLDCQLNQIHSPLSIEFYVNCSTCGVRAIGACGADRLVVQGAAIGTGDRERKAEKIAHSGDFTHKPIIHCRFPTAFAGQFPNAEMPPFTVHL